MDVRGEYLKNEVSSAKPEQLLILLLEGAENFIRKAQKELLKKNIENTHNYIVKAQNIYLELFSILDPESEDFIANLQGLYYMLYDNLLEADIKKDSATLEKCLKIASGLTKMWRETVDKYHGELRHSDDGVSSVKQIDIRG